MLLELNRPKEFNMSYGRHQSFYLKEHWITKGLKSFNNTNSSLYRVNGYLDLGIGKNMQQSLRFWMESSFMVRTEQDSIRLTNLGDEILKNDIGCLTNTSRNIIHYFLASDIEKKEDNADSIIWFFNSLQERTFSKDYLLSELVLFSEGKISENTLKRDIDCLISLYVSKEKANPEDRNISLLADLGLIQRKDKDIYSKARIRRDKLSFSALYFILLHQNSINNSFLTIESQIQNKNGIGKIFNLNRVELIEIFEQMKNEGFNIDITRTNNLDTINLGKSNLNEFFSSKLWRVENEK